MGHPIIQPTHQNGHLRKSDEREILILNQELHPRFSDDSKVIPREGSLWSSPIREFLSDHPWRMENFIREFSDDSK